MKKIDWEHHYYIPELLEYLKTRDEFPHLDAKTLGLVYRSGQTGVPFSLQSYNPADEDSNRYDDITSFGELRIKQMDKYGVDVAVLSSSPGIEELPKAESVKFAKMSNDAVCELIKKYPGRFLGSATLPTLYVEEAIEELKRCKKMGFVFWNTHSNYKDEHLFDEKFEPLLKTAAELDMPIYVHPQASDDEDMKNVSLIYPVSGLGFGQDTMKTTLRIILNGTFDRYPDLKMIIGHLGEYYPFVLTRMDNCFSTDQYVKNKKPISYYFKNKNIFVTTSGNESAGAMLCTKNAISVDNILFATDFPYESMGNMVEAITGSGVFSEDELEKIFHKNGEEYILKSIGDL